LSLGCGCCTKGEVAILEARVLCLRRHHHLQAGAFVFGARALCLGRNRYLEVGVVVFETRASYLRGPVIFEGALPYSRGHLRLEPRTVVLEAVPSS
jgi:hypothetical protein